MKWYVEFRHPDKPWIRTEKPFKNKESAELFSQIIPIDDDVEIRIVPALEVIA